MMKKKISYSLLEEAAIYQALTSGFTPLKGRNSRNSCRLTVHLLTH